MYLTIDNKILLTIPKIVHPIDDMNLNLITMIVTTTKTAMEIIYGNQIHCRSHNVNL